VELTTIKKTANNNCKLKQFINLEYINFCLKKFLNSVFQFQHKCYKQRQLLLNNMKTHPDLLQGRLSRKLESRKTMVSLLMHNVYNLYIFIGIYYMYLFAKRYMGRLNEHSGWFCRGS